MSDMRIFAERLAQAMPDRFKLKSNLLRDADNMPPGTHWTDFSTYAHELRMDSADVSRWWAFWGPLADEMKIDAISVGTFDGDCHFVGPTDLLEATADAVCQEAERRVGTTP